MKFNIFYARNMKSNYKIDLSKLLCSKNVLFLRIKVSKHEISSSV